MLNRKFGLLFAFVIATLMLAACSPAAGSQQDEEPRQTPAPTSEVTQEPTQAPTEEATEAQPNSGTQGGLIVNGAQPAIDALAEKLNVSVQDISLVSVEQVEWNDSCLGVGGPDEMCAQMITPGWKVVLEVDGKQYEVHTD